MGITGSALPPGGVLATQSAGSLTAEVAENHSGKQNGTGREPNLVFPVISDVHVDTASTQDNENFERALGQLNVVAPDQDAFVVVGDLTDYGYQAEYDRFFGIYNRLKQPGAESILTMGNHDYWNGLAEQDAQKRFMANTGRDELYFHEEVEGYHFIALSPEKGNTHGHYSTSQIDWLDEQLALAEDANPEAPIFVFMHQPVKDTVYGSDLWGTTDNVERLYETFAKYPQVINFAGHSHYPLEDPRSIHQKDFTSVGTGSVSYLELEPGKVQGIHPPLSREISQGLVVEVYDQEVLIKRRDFHANDWSAEPWIIKTPVKSKHFNYMEDRDAKAPKFKQQDRASVATGLDSAEVTFPQARDNLLVHSYRLTATNAATGEIGGEVTAFADFYYDPVPENLTFTIPGLRPAVEYEFAVTALDSFGNPTKKPLTTTASTTALELVSAVADPEVMDDGKSALLVALQNHGTEPVGGRLELIPDAGLTVGEAAQEFNLAGGETRTVTIPVSAEDGLKGSASISVEAFTAGTSVGTSNVQFYAGLLLGQNFDSLSPQLKPAQDENIPPSNLGWTHTPPAGWSVETSTDMPQGVQEWQGWSFASRTFWSAAENQDRANFNKASGVVAVADPDEWDDKGSPAAKGRFDSTLSSPKITVEPGQELKLSFLSHYKQEAPQRAAVTAVFGNGETEELMLYSSDASSDNAGGHVLNEQVELSLTVPDGAASVSFDWRLFDAGNNWYWAVDDIRLS